MLIGTSKSWTQIANLIVALVPFLLIGRGRRDVHLGRDRRDGFRHRSVFQFGSQGARLSSDGHRTRDSLEVRHRRRVGGGAGISGGTPTKRVIIARKLKIYIYVK